MTEFHYTALQGYKQCARRAKYQYRDKIEPVAPQYGLLIGTDLHAIVAEAFRPGDNQIQRYNDAVAEAVRHYPDSDTNPEIKIGNNVFTHENVRDMIALTAKRFWETRRNAILDQYDVVDVEKPFKFTDENGDTYAGTIDLVLRDKKTKELVILDWKSMVNSFPENYLELNSQKYMYAIGCTALYGELPTRFIVGGIKKKKVKYPALLKNGTLSQAKDENVTWESYMTTINQYNLNVEDYSEILTFYQQHDAEDLVNRFPTAEISLTEDMIITGWQGIVEMRMMWEFSVKNNIWPKCDGTNCAMCKNSYRELCIAEEMGADTTELMMDKYLVGNKDSKPFEWDM